MYILFRPLFQKNYFSVFTTSSSFDEVVLIVRDKNYILIGSKVVYNIPYRVCNSYGAESLVSKIEARAAIDDMQHPWRIPLPWSNATLTFWFMYSSTSSTILSNSISLILTNFFFQSVKQANISSLISTFRYFPSISYRVHWTFAFLNPN